MFQKETLKPNLQYNYRRPDSFKETYKGDLKLKIIYSTIKVTSFKKFDGVRKIRVPVLERKTYYCSQQSSKLVM